MIQVEDWIEPFVSSAGEIIDSMVASIPRAEEGFCLMFSDSRFPDANMRLDWVEAEMGEIIQVPRLRLNRLVVPCPSKIF